MTRYERTVKECIRELTVNTCECKPADNDAKGGPAKRPFAESKQADSSQGQVQRPLEQKARVKPRQCIW